MNQKRRPPIDVALQQAHAFMCGIPAFDHDVVKLIAQKSIHYGFVFAAHFEKVRQRADGARPPPREFDLSSLRTVSVE